MLMSITIVLFFILAIMDVIIILNCFSVAGFSLDDPNWVAEKTKQIRLAQEYIDKHPDGSDIELSSSILYNMNVYH